MEWGKLQKLNHFIGLVDRSYPPVFLNSVPKAGTNLVERLLILHGYRRNFSVCYNEQNLNGKSIKARPGRFDIGHLFDDELCHINGHRTIYVHRALWPCIRSYLNYMFIDPNHPASEFIREGICTGQAANFIERLVFHSDNPLGRSLVFEYERFFEIDLDRYDLVIDYDDFKALEEGLVERLATFLKRPDQDMLSLMEASLDSKTWTKNSGAIDVFSDLPKEFVEELSHKIARLDKLSGQSA